MQMKQIQDFGEKYNITPRHTIRIVQELEKLGFVTKARIKEKRKRKGYIMNEDNIETLSEINTWSQKRISQFIDEWHKNYHDSLVIRPNDSKKLKKIKEDQKKIYSWLTLHDMHHCVQWIANIEWALRTGSLGNGKGKINLAERNIRKLEKFIEEMSRDLKEHDEHIWKHVLGSGMTHTQFNILLGNEPIATKAKL